jgi:phosphoglycerate-specific signal transduction histidine kinase
VAIGSAQAAFNWLGKQPPKLEEVQQSLSRVVEAGAQATEFIERIRNLIKKRDPQKAPFDINNAILDVVDLTRREMANNKVSVQTQFAGDLPFIQGDRVQMQQVMLNLIINAVEAMTEVDEGSRRLLIGTREGSDGLLVTVQDSGPGIGQESLGKLFDAFYTTKPDGMGMGLSRSAGRSLKRMAAACRPAHMMVRVRRFSLRCLMDRMGTPIEATLSASLSHACLAIDRPLHGSVGTFRELSTRQKKASRHTKAHA